jgi:hypothetical protein
VVGRGAGDEHGQEVRCAFHGEGHQQEEVTCTNGEGYTSSG